MLNWSIKPHPWFQDVVRWSLQRVCVELQIPKCINSTPFSDTLGLDPVSDSALNCICAELLRGSEHALMHKPTGYQFLVLDRVLRWSLSECEQVADGAIARIRDRYFWDRDYEQYCGEYPLYNDLTVGISGEGPNKNHNDPAEELSKLLYSDV